MFSIDERLVTRDETVQWVGHMQNLQGTNNSTIVINKVTSKLFCNTEEYRCKIYEDADCRIISDASTTNRSQACAQMG